MHRYSLPDERFMPLGRHDPDETASQLWWSGSGVRTLISCTKMEAEITSTASGHAAWAGVLMDGEPVARFPLLEGTHRYLVLAGLEEGFSHEVSIIRDSQPSYDEQGPVILSAVYTDGEPKRPAKRPLLIEFLGDSLTVGEGCLGPKSAQEWRMIWISHMPAFPSLVAEKMNAEKRVIALGGWGAARSWDNQKESRIGRIYGQLCAITPGGNVPAPASNREGIADAVVINLGTNDSSALKSLPAEEVPSALAELKDRAKELIQMAAGRNPGAKILWAYGLCGHDERVDEALVKAVEEAKKDFSISAAYLSLTPSRECGSRSHPSREGHQVAAEEITKALLDMMKG